MEHKVVVGGYEVVASGVVIIPADQGKFSIHVRDLTFSFEFLSTSENKTFEADVVGMELHIKLYNCNNLAGQGISDRYLNVGTVEGRQIGLAFMVYTNDNKSRVFQYTFAYLSPK